MTSSYELNEFLDADSEIARLKYRSKLYIDKTLEIIVSKMAGVSKAQVLEVGSGTGYRAERIASCLVGSDIFCVDTNSEMLNETSISLNSIDRERWNVFNDLDKIEDETMDLVYLRLVLQHQGDQIKFLADVASKLKKGGLLFVEDTDRGFMSIAPMPEEWDELYELIQLRQKERGGNPWTGRSLGQLVHAAGCTEIDLNCFTVSKFGDECFEWLRYFAPTYLNLSSESERKKGLKILASTSELWRSRLPEYHHVWFQCSGRRI